MKEMVRIGTLVAQVVATAGGERATLEEGTSDRGQLGVITTTAITVRKQNELNLSAGRSNIGRIADLGASEEAIKDRHSRRQVLGSKGGARSGRTD